MSAPEIRRLADELHAAALAYWDTRTRVDPGLYRLSEIPDPSPDSLAAIDALRELGERLASQPGGNIMSPVYDEAVERYGYEGVRGVNHIWTGIGGWMA